MARILAIDYGSKRVGLAVSDPLQIIAQGLTTVDTPKALDYIVHYIQSENVVSIVVGNPLSLDGTPGPMTPKVQAFAKKIHEKFPDIPIHWEDERYSSKEAAQTLILSGLKKKARRNKRLLDEVSATIILQSFMER